MAFGETPEISATFSGVYSAMRFLYSSKLIASPSLVPGSCPREGAVALHELAVERAALHEQVGHAEGDGPDRCELEHEDVLGVRARTRAPGRQVDEDDLLAPRAPIDDAGEEHRVHLGGVVAPQDTTLLVEVVVDPGRLVHTVRGEEAVTAEAMQSRALGSIWLFASAPFTSFWQT